MRPSLATESGAYAHASPSIRPSAFVTCAMTLYVLGSTPTGPALVLTHTVPSGAAAMPTTSPPPSAGRSSVAIACGCGLVSRIESDTLVPTHSFPRCHNSDRVEFVGAPLVTPHAGAKTRVITSRPATPPRRSGAPASAGRPLVADDLPAKAGAPFPFPKGGAPFASGIVERNTPLSIELTQT